MSGPAEPGAPAAILREPVPDEFLERVLDPYLLSCRYLRQAVVERPAGEEPPAEFDGALVRAVGEFQGCEPWYIRDTGHLNSIEFNLCYNQLGYVLLACATEGGAVPYMREMSREEFFARQLPNTLIGKIEMRFLQPMRTDHYQGTVTIDRVTRGKRALRIGMRCWYSREGQRCSEGDIELFIVDRG